MVRYNGSELMICLVNTVFNAKKKKIFNYSYIQMYNNKYVVQWTDITSC